MDSRLGAGSALQVAQGLAQGWSCQLCCSIVALQGLQQPVLCLFSRFMRKGEHNLDFDLGDMAPGSWEQSLPASCLATAAVIEFSIFVGSWSPHTRVSWAVFTLTIHWLELNPNLASQSCYSPELWRMVWPPLSMSWECHHLSGQLEVLQGR